MSILKKAFDKFIDLMSLHEYSDDKEDVEEDVDTCNNCDDTSDDGFFDDNEEDDYIDTCNDCDDVSNAEILSAVMKANEIIGISIIDSDGHSRFLLCGQHNTYSVLGQ